MPAKKSVKPVAKKSSVPDRLAIAKAEHEQAEIAYKAALAKAEQMAEQRSGHCHYCSSMGQIRHEAHWDSGWPDWHTDCQQCQGRGKAYSREQRDAVLASFANKTEEEREIVRVASQALRRAEERLAQEKALAAPRAGFMARVVKGKKLPKGDYQCHKTGDGGYGPYALLAKENGEKVFVSQDNVIGLAECCECKAHGTTGELAYDIPSGRCGPCCDKAKEEGRENF